ncbi:hypothetical protein Hanom_Chr06g00511711 [Helianthus anomalus]
MKVVVDGKSKTISFVSYVLSMKRNILTLEQLLFQGIEVTTSSETCTLKKMFGDKSKGVDIFKDKSEEDLEQKYLNKFYENLEASNC